MPRYCKRSLFECRECGRRFIKERLLEIHKEFHSQRVKSYCLDCKKFANNPLALHKHVLTHSKVRPHECSVCKKKFVNMIYLKKHMVLHKLGKIPRNAFAAANRKDIEKHVITSGSDTSETDDGAELLDEEDEYNIFDDDDHSLNRHLKFKTDWKIYPTDPLFKNAKVSLVGLKILMCRCCERMVTSLYENREFALDAGLTTPTKCLRCQGDLILLRSELHQKVGRIYLLQSPPLQCVTCTDVFPTMRKLREHMQVHSELTSRTCEMCGESFLQLDLWKAHLYCHSQSWIGTNRCSIKLDRCDSSLDKPVPGHPHHHRHHQLHQHQQQQHQKHQHHQQQQHQKYHHHHQLSVSQNGAPAVSGNDSDIRSSNEETPKRWRRMQTSMDLAPRRNSSPFQALGGAMPTRRKSSEAPRRLCGKALFDSCAPGKGDRQHAVSEEELLSLQTCPEAGAASRKLGAGLPRKAPSGPSAWRQNCAQKISVPLVDCSTSTSSLESNRNRSARKRYQTTGVCNSPRDSPPRKQLQTADVRRSSSDQVPEQRTQAVLEQLPPPAEGSDVLVINGKLSGRSPQKVTLNGASVWPVLPVPVLEDSQPVPSLCTSDAAVPLRKSQRSPRRPKWMWYDDKDCAHTCKVCGKTFLFMDRLIVHSAAHKKIKRQELLN